MAASKFNGLTNIEDFIIDFNIVSNIKTWNDEQKKYALAAYLEGPALSFYKAQFSSFTTYDDVVAKLKAEFPSREDFVQSFYYRKQHETESPLEYFYALSALASKAKITDKPFIQHYMKSVLDKYKPWFAPVIFQTKNDLKNTIWQSMEIYSDNTDTSSVNLPLLDLNVPNSSPVASSYSIPSTEPVYSPQSNVQHTPQSQ